MFERYALFDIEQLRDRFQLPGGVPSGVKKHYNISPTQTAPVVLIRDGNRVMERMKWGFIPPHAKDTNSVFRYKTFNASSTNIFEKATWQHAVRYRRCLVPANGFYIWRMAPSGKQAFFVQSKNYSLLALAGVYGSWTDPDGVEHGTYSIVTTMPNKEMATVSDRMPVIIERQDEATWLDPTVDDANSLYDLMRPGEDDTLRLHLVDLMVSSPKINTPNLIEPLHVDR